jgi:hypothetical protein
MPTTTKVKLSDAMFNALDMFRQNNSLILPAYFIRSGTAVALIRRGLISTEWSGHHQLLPAGARQLRRDFDYQTLVDQAHEQALAEDADRVVCIVPGCGEAYTSGAWWSSSDQQRTATERMRLHVAAAHVPVSVIGWVSLGQPLPDERWETVCAYLKAQEPRAAINRERVAALLSAGSFEVGPTGSMVVTASGQRKIAEVVARNTAEVEESPKPTTEDVLLGLVDAVRNGMSVGVSFTLDDRELSVQLPQDRVDLLDEWARYFNSPIVDGGKISGWRHLSVVGVLRGYPVEVWTADYRKARRPKV